MISSGPAHHPTLKIACTEERTGRTAILEAGHAKAQAVEAGHAKAQACSGTQAQTQVAQTIDSKAFGVEAEGVIADNEHRRILALALPTIRIHADADADADADTHTHRRQHGPTSLTKDGHSCAHKRIGADLGTCSGGCRHMQPRMAETMLRAHSSQGEETGQVPCTRQT